MKILYLLVFLFVTPKDLVADDSVNRVTICSLRNYMDLYVQLENIKNAVCTYLQSGQAPKTNISEIRSIANDLDNLRRSGLELLPMSAKDVFEKNFLVLARREKMIICFFDMRQDRKLEMLTPNWVQYNSYNGPVLENVLQFTNLQLSTLMQLLSNYIALDHYRVSDSKSAAIEEDGKIEDLNITFLGHGIGGCFAQFMGLHFDHMHPTMTNDHLSIITFGAESCFDPSVAEFYDHKLKSSSLNILHENDPVSRFQIPPDSNLRQVGTFVLCPDPGSNRHTLRGYHESVYLLSQENYKVYEQE